METQQREVGASRSSRVPAGFFNERDGAARIGIPRSTLRFLRQAGRAHPVAPNKRVIHYTLNELLRVQKAITV
jgi:hypothetical protein